MATKASKASTKAVSSGKDSKRKTPPRRSSADPGAPDRVGGDGAKTAKSSTKGTANSASKARSASGAKKKAPAKSTAGRSGRKAAASSRAYDEVFRACKRRANGAAPAPMGISPTSDRRRPSAPQSSAEVSAHMRDRLSATGDELDMPRRSRPSQKDAKLQSLFEG
jgi:hypothetical protein